MVYQRYTRQRQIILEELRKRASHPTAVALYEIVRHRLPKISLGTVYRNLDLLARTGLIQRLDLAGAETHFDGNVAHQDHVRCVDCGRIDDVAAPPVDIPGGEAGGSGGYKILGHRLEFFGLCPKCRRDKNRMYSLTNLDRSKNHVEPENPGCLQQAD